MTTTLSVTASSSEDGLIEEVPTQTAAGFTIKDARSTVGYSTSGTTLDLSFFCARPRMTTP
jgi:hypothetical protein